MAKQPTAAKEGAAPAAPTQVTENKEAVTEPVAPVAETPTEVAADFVTFNGQKIAVDALFVFHVPLEVDSGEDDGRICMFEPGVPRQLPKGFIARALARGVTVYKPE